MKRPTLPCALTIAMGLLSSFLTLSPNQYSHADEVDLRRLLAGPERCDHVISLLLRHGVNNDSSYGGAAETRPWAAYPMGAIQMNEADIGDLELVSIVRQAGTTTGCGPTFDVVIKNCSTRDVCHSRLTLVGLLGRIRSSSPNSTIKIDSLPAGQAVQVSVTMPAESLSMGNLNGHVLGFNQILVAVDSFDQFMESNEANNLRLFDLAAIPLATSAVVSVEESTEPAITTEIAPAVGSTSNSSAAPQSAATQSAAIQSAATQPAANATATVMPTVTLTENDLRSAINQFTSEEK